MVLSLPMTDGQRPFPENVLRELAEVLYQDQKDIIAIGSQRERALHEGGEEGCLRACRQYIDWLGDATAQDVRSRAVCVDVHARGQLKPFMHELTQIWERDGYPSEAARKLANLLGLA